MLKKCFFIIFTFLFVSQYIIGQQLEGDEEQKINAVINKWNDCHNHWNIKELNDIYANKVLFYTQKLSASKCISKKSNMLSPSKAFTQKIVSIDKYRKYKNGLVRVDFIKSVFKKNKTTEYPSYLVLSKLNDDFKIVGESDLVTDKNLNFQFSPDLFLLNIESSTATKIPSYKYSGSKSQKSNTLLYLGIVGLLIVVAIYYYRKQKPKNVIQDEPVALKKETKEETITISNIVIAETNDEELSNIEKGKAFEEFIIKKFNPNRFKLLDRTSDTNIGGIIAESNKNPDFLYLYHDDSPFERKFAIECKYQTIIKDQIVLAKEKSIENYRTYSQNVCEEVYIVLGLGGKPYNPMELFIIPLKDLSSNQISYDTLKRYYNKSNMGYFFYNKSYKKLT